jgi:hypothetical protein
VIIRLTGALLLILGGVQSGVHPARAFEPIKDYWFIEMITVSDVELPSGVEILASDPSSQPRGSLVLSNQSETPLYVMSLRYKDVLAMATPDSNWKTRLIGAHEVASYLVAPERPANLYIEALVDLDPNLVDRNVLSINPPPPDASIPAEQSSELLLVYAEQVIEMPFTLGYALNTKFDNGSGANQYQIATVQATNNASATATQQAELSAARVMRNNIVVIGLAATAILLIGGWLVWRRLSLRR